MREGKARKGRSRKVSRYTLEPTTSSLTTLREFLKATLSPYPQVEPYMEDIISATHEAAKNAVVHNPDSNGPVEVRCEVSDDAVVIEICDRGRGFKLMYSLMDKVETESDLRGTRVRLIKRLQPALS
jgi:anti-sigma regulatory factor (Ser/Thr protein kinase)